MSDISADKQYKLICEKGRALLKHICKRCIYGKLILRWLLKINENENDDCITSYDVYCDVTYPEYLHVHNRYYKNLTSLKCFKIIVF